MLAALADLLTPNAVRAAATLRLADHVDGRRDAAALATVLGVAAGPLRSLVEHLARVGVLDLADDGAVSLTAVGELLRTGHPGSWRTHLDLDGAPGLVARAWAGLPDAVRTGRAAFPSTAGGDFWDVVGGSPALAGSFAAWLGDWADDWVPAVADAVDLAGAGCVLDVGGGDGRLLVALLRADAGARGLLVELPATAALARDRVVAAGLAARCEVVAGSFFDPLPEAEVVLLAQVLHDWPDDDARRVLAGAARAAGPHGRVVLVERLADDGAHPGADLQVLVLFGGHERTAAELGGLAADVGLALVASTATAGPLHVLELVPAPDDQEPS